MELHLLHRRIKLFIFLDFEMNFLQGTPSNEYKKKTFYVPISTYANTSRSYANTRMNLKLILDHRDAMETV